MPKTLADRYADIDPDELTVDQLLMWGLTTEVVGLRRDVLTERRGRRLSVLVITVAIALALLVGSLVAVNIHADQKREARTRQLAAAQTCETRKEASARIRRAVAAAVDEGAKVLEASPATREMLAAAVAKRIIAEYPPPDC